MNPIGSLLFALLLLSAPVLGTGAKYRSSETIVGEQFLDVFDFQNIADPTHGRVTYVDLPTALKRGLVKTGNGTFTLGTDSTTVLKSSGPGRDSVRIRSKKTYTHHVAIFNVRHMPQGCATWPAIWECDDDNWPTSGETDILEGVNGQGPNQMTLHTTKGCTMPTQREQTGITDLLNCDIAATQNKGCGVKSADSLGYGSAFNKNGGGWYAIERTKEHISIWFWSRDNPRVPQDVSELTKGEIDTSTWGLPSAYFPNTLCDIEKFFLGHKIIINLTLCGDWAGQQKVYKDSGCPSTCVDFVDKNPTAFKDAYFDFASLRIFLPLDSAPGLTTTTTTTFNSSSSTSSTTTFTEEDSGTSTSNTTLHVEHDSGTSTSQTALGKNGKKGTSTSSTKNHDESNSSSTTTTGPDQKNQEGANGGSQEMKPADAEAPKVSGAATATQETTPSNGGSGAAKPSTESSKPAEPPKSSAEPLEPSAEASKPLAEPSTEEKVPSPTETPKAPESNQIAGHKDKKTSNIQASATIDTVPVKVSSDLVEKPGDAGGKKP